MRCVVGCCLVPKAQDLADASPLTLNAARRVFFACEHLAAGVSIPYDARMISRPMRLLLCILLVIAPAVRAQTPKTVFLEELTWTELRDQIRSGKTTILLPIGATEQNGPHMALGKHNVRAKILSEKIALALGNALVAPVMAYVPEGGISPPTAHMRFPGTITVPDETFEKVLEYAARSFKLHGFRDIVFLGDHGGYQKDIKVVADRLNQEWATASVRVHVAGEYYRVTQSEYERALKGRGYTAEEIGTHAGLTDTSVMLALDPRMVRTDRLQPGSKLGRADGVYGDPHRSSAELGKLGVDAIVSQTVEAIRKASGQR
jgi:creatinine amidohydrolase/Fe(II)-dependent formamide hydrolase-like protein